MSKFIRIGKELVEVNDKVYKAYYQCTRRERYFNSDIKVGRIDVDMQNEKVTFVPSKEDSIQRLIDLGTDFEGSTNVEDIVYDNAVLEILHKAMEELKSEEQELIKAIYFENLTTRDIADRENISQPAIVKRHKKVLEKLKKYFS